MTHLVDLEVVLHPAPRAAAWFGNFPHVGHNVAARRAASPRPQVMSLLQWVSDRLHGVFGFSDKVVAEFVLQSARGAGLSQPDPR